MHYAYLLQDLLGRVYTGRTENLQQRLHNHAAGKVWTTKRMKKPRLVFYEAFRAKEDAIRRERYLKTTKGKTTMRLMLRESLKR